MTHAIYSLSFKKRITIIVKRAERVVALTNEANLIIADATAKETKKKIQRFMNQIDDFDNVFNFDHDYNQDWVLQENSTIVDSSFSSFSDRYTMITEVINEKSNNDVFFHESRYDYLNDDENENDDENDDEDDDENNDENENENDEEDDKK